MPSSTVLIVLGSHRRLQDCQSPVLPRPPPQAPLGADLAYRDFGGVLYFKSAGPLDDEKERIIQQVSLQKVKALKITFCTISARVQQKTRAQ